MFIFEYSKKYDYNIEYQPHNLFFLRVLMSFCGCWKCGWKLYLFI